MRRFGGIEDLLELIWRPSGRSHLTAELQQRDRRFPVKTDEDVDAVRVFLEAARLDAVGVFAYSDEDEMKPAQTPRRRRSHRGSPILTVDLVDELMEQRAAERNENGGVGVVWSRSTTERPVVGLPIKGQTTVWLRQ